MPIKKSSERVPRELTEGLSFGSKVTDGAKPSKNLMAAKDKQKEVEARRKAKQDAEAERLE